jgi:FkbM family methyltransferase
MSEQLRSYWQDAARCIKRALVGRQKRQIAGSTFAVAYEARPHRFQGRSDDFVILREMCRGAKCVLDVGGHLGISALVMQRSADRDGRVIVFEPSEESCVIALENCKLNGVHNVEIVNCLVGKRGGKVERFMWNHSSDRSSMKGVPYGSFISFGKCVVSIDDFVAERQVAPDRVKIDVEGAETEVLEGMERTLRTARPIVAVEVHAWKEQALSIQMDSILRIANQCSYQVIDFEGGAIVSKCDEYRHIAPPEHVDAQARIVLVPFEQAVPSWIHVDNEK